jgi:hypothetical protein
MKTNKLTFVFLFFSAIFCFQSRCLLAQQSSWSTDKDGWVLRKKPGDKKYEKFFAICLWNIPGYNRTKSTDPDSVKSNTQLFLEKTKYYNMKFAGSDQPKDFKNGLIPFISQPNFPAVFRQYLDKVPSINSDPVASPYLRSQYIRKDINNPKLKDALDSMINFICQKNSGNDYGWAPIDEIIQAGASGKWNWPACVGDIIYERIKQKQKDALVFTDLMGVGRGNSYLFEQLYLKTHASLPDNPPLELLSNEARECVKNPLLGFRMAYDGSPVYTFKNGEYRYKEYDFETLKRLWFENVKRCSAGFKNSGNVFGINAFRDFFAYPVLSGITVDAIKAGISPEIPVWLYFDGNGYAKESNVSTENYVKSVKCQMYTSIIHGATGVLFWNDKSKPTDVFDAIAPVLKEMTDNVEIFYLKTVETKIDNDLHYMIKKKDNKHKYIIATNTSLTETLPINVKGISKKSLKPLEVYVAPI